MVSYIKENKLILDISLDMCILFLHIITVHYLQRTTAYGKKSAGGNFRGFHGFSLDSKSFPMNYDLVDTMLMNLQTVLLAPAILPLTGEH